MPSFPRKRVVRHRSPSALGGAPPVPRQRVVRHRCLSSFRRGRCATSAWSQRAVRHRYVTSSTENGRFATVSRTGRYATSTFLWGANGRSATVASPTPALGGTPPLPRDDGRFATGARFSSSNKLIMLARSLKNSGGLSLNPPEFFKLRAPNPLTEQGNPALKLFPEANF